MNKVERQPLFVYFRPFQLNYRINAGFSGIKTGIVRIACEHTDHFTTTATSQTYFISLLWFVSARIQGNQKDVGTIL